MSDLLKLGWRDFHSKVAELNDPEEIKRLIKKERKGQNRSSFINRLKGRYAKLKIDNAREEACQL